MIDLTRLDRRPLIVAVAGPNGTGKTTFYHAHLEALALPFVNADALGRELDLEPYDAADAADAVRRTLVRDSQSFVFETVFSDPVGDKLSFLRDAVDAGYTVVLCFIGVSGPEVSEQRVAMRVSQGGHDVPVTKLRARYRRTLENLGRAIHELPFVVVYDNDELSRPFRLAAVFERGETRVVYPPTPGWLASRLPDSASCRPSGR